MTNPEQSGQPKRSAGRPKGTPRTERTTVIPMIRCTPDQREKFERLGGADWVRAQIDKARG